MTLRTVYRAGIVLTAVGLAGAVWPRPNTDDTFDPFVRRPAFHRRPPRVMIDEAHSNTHTAEGLYRPFAQLIGRDGCRVIRNRDPFREETLAPATVLVIANALGLRGVIERAAGLGITPEAIDGGEASAVDRWVRGGGSLLLIAGHAPAGTAIRRLNEKLGVRMSEGWVEDPSRADPVTRDASAVVYSRTDESLAYHPAADYCERVAVVSGQALTGPAGSTSLLTLGPGARDYPRRDSNGNAARSAAGKSQGVAFELGKGRVVVLGDAALFTARIERGQRVGMGRKDMDNRQFALSVVRWLARLDLEPKPKSD